MVSGYETFRHIFTVHAQKRLFRSFRSKIWPHHSLRRPRFPIRRVYFHCPMTFSYLMFLCTIQPFDLGSVWWHCQAWHIQNTIFSTLRLSIPELCVTQSDHITITWNGHFACAMSCDLSPGGKNDPNFWNPWPQFTYSLCHFQGAVTKFKPCYMRKIALIPLSRLQHINCSHRAPKRHILGLNDVF